MEKGETLWVDYNKYLFVRVNKIVREEDFRVHNKYLWQGPLSERIRLPGKGKFQIIGKGDALDNSQWSEIVDSKKERGGAFNPEVCHYQSTGWTTFYKNYEHTEPSICIPNTATESGYSLLRLLEMEPGTTLVLKKI